MDEGACGLNLTGKQAEAHHHYLETLCDMTWLSRSNWRWSWKHHRHYYSLSIHLSHVCLDEVMAAGRCSVGGY